MINKRNIDHIEKVISLELSNNMKECYGSWEYKQLLQIQGMIKVLNQQLEKHGK